MCAIHYRSVRGRCAQERLADEARSVPDVVGRLPIGRPAQAADAPCQRPGGEGVIGRQRILFDLWGDTVNTASQMQSSRIPSQIHVTP